MSPEVNYMTTEDGTKVKMSNRFKRKLKKLAGKRPATLTLTPSGQVAVNPHGRKDERSIRSKRRRAAIHAGHPRHPYNLHRRKDE